MRRVSGAASGFGRSPGFVPSARDGINRPSCFSCGALDHFSKDCPKKGDPKHRLADRVGQMPQQSRSNFSKFSSINAIPNPGFDSETYCAYHVSDTHSIADCTTVQEHRRNGHEWCNSCASTTHDTADCRGGRPRQGGGSGEAKKHLG